jgi:hypothetical protein
MQLEVHLNNECSNTVVQCPEHCPLSLRRSEVPAHLRNECPHSVIACSFENESGQRCGYECMRMELIEHQLVCNLRKVKCHNQDCQAKVTYCDYSVHANLCTFKVLDCDCGLKVTRGDLSHHKAESCPKQQIDCPYARLGCDAVFLRQHLPTHLEAEAVSHSLSTVRGLERQHKEIVTLQNEISLLRLASRDDIRKIHQELSILRNSRRRVPSLEEFLRVLEED